MYILLFLGILVSFLGPSTPFSKHASGQHRGSLPKTKTARKPSQTEAPPRQLIFSYFRVGVVPRERPHYDQGTWNKTQER